MADSFGTGSWDHILMTNCPHLADLNINITSDATQCAMCELKENLRLCMTCGYVACCESGNGHDTLHFNQLDHPFIKPHKTNYDWLWCYKCNAFLD